MGCTLVARGKAFEVESFLKRTKLPIKNAHFWIRGTPIYNKKRRHHDSGFSEWVSRDKWDNLSAAIADVVKFLKDNRKDLVKLKRAKGIEDLMLDFAFNSRVGTENVAMQGEYLPPEFLASGGRTQHRDWTFAIPGTGGVEIEEQKIDKEVIEVDHVDSNISFPDHLVVGLLVSCSTRIRQICPRSQITRPALPTAF